MKTLLISGYDGRMGQETVRLAASYGFDAQPFNPDAPGDVIIDFSHPDLLPSLLKGGLPLVIGTTGFSPIQRQAIQNAAAARPIFLAANFSPGIWVLQRLAAMAGELLPGWDAALIERHHAKKQDSPSGTALQLAEQANIHQVCSIRGGTVRGIHELSFLGPEESLALIHTAESRAVFAHGALRVACWLLDRPNGLYGMDDLMQT
ncbi:MAG: 4-hydroxy-tetrahydrodipicolinate reductase [Clostridia bacterium]|nr:4-hydroxy-tetrahydrodipicolinate reductase [Clostridia bacterium]